MDKEILKDFLERLVNIKIWGYLSSKSYLAVTNILTSNRVKKLELKMQVDLLEMIDGLLESLEEGRLTNKEFRKTLKMVAILYTPKEYVKNLDLYEEEEERLENVCESPFNDISDNIDNWNDYYNEQEDEDEWESSFSDTTNRQEEWDIGTNEDNTELYEELHLPSNEEYYAQLKENLQNYANAFGVQEEDNEHDNFEDLEEQSLVGDDELFDFTENNVDFEEDDFEEDAFEEDDFEDIEDSFDEQDENNFDAENVKDIEAKIKDLDNTVEALDALTDYALDGDTTKIEELWEEKQGKKS